MLARAALSRLAKRSTKSPKGLQVGFLACSRALSTLPKLPIFEALLQHDPTTTAIAHSVSGQKFTYGRLLRDVIKAKKELSDCFRDQSIEGERIAFLVENSYNYVVTLLSIWGCNAIALPLSPAHPISELKHILSNSEARLILSSSKYEVLAIAASQTGAGQDLKVSVVHKAGKSLDSGPETEIIELNSNNNNKGGLILYTSGTTSHSKGVLLSSSAIAAQSYSLINAWKYSPKDRLLHILPLHHIHGVVNGIIAPLFAGSSIEFLFPFNANRVWERLAAPFLAKAPEKPEVITILTAVPTIYDNLLSALSKLSPDEFSAIKAALAPQELRLNISGSSALPSTLKNSWSELTSGNELLERYGMTEVGMALSCGLDFKDRVDGSVGWPLPSVEVRLVDPDSKETIQPNEEIDENGKEREGEIYLRGPTIFSEYWRNQEATSAAFTGGKGRLGRWFKTGDIAVRRMVSGTGMSKQEWAGGPMYFIKGRKSTDIIKSGGEKISALEVEREALTLPQIREIAVVGLPSHKWGQKVAAVVVLDPALVNSGRNGKLWNAIDMRRGLNEKLASYKIPRIMKVVEKIPRNAMGKIFEEATKGLLEEYKDGAIPEEDRRLITSKTSIQEFQTAVEDAKARYQGTSTSKSKIFILNRVKGAVETLRRFQSAADVLVQASMLQ
ncbi:MAG: hypothetical protein M1829_004127 [Trizodia sp. TS-e1964]|nr:MAG: hypothetical protein M1829_004127 [Trizodia sp. TS-e1964]